MLSYYDWQWNVVRNHMLSSEQYEKYFSMDWQPQQAGSLYLLDLFFQFSWSCILIIPYDYVPNYWILLIVLVLGCECPIIFID